MFIYVYLCSSMFIYVHLCLSMFIYVYLCLSMFLLVVSGKKGPEMEWNGWGIQSTIRYGCMILGYWKMLVSAASSPCHAGVSMGYPRLWLCAAWYAPTVDLPNMFAFMSWHKCIHTYLPTYVWTYVRKFIHYVTLHYITLHLHLHFQLQVHYINYSTYRIIYKLYSYTMLYIYMCVCEPSEEM